jgi:hypothetical protein
LVYGNTFSFHFYSVDLASVIETLFQKQWGVDSVVATYYSELRSQTLETLVLFYSALTVFSLKNANLCNISFNNYL